MTRRLVLLLALAAAPAVAQVREFRIDAGHSDIAFSIGFLGHPVRGRFDDVRGTLSYAANNPTASSITVVIAAKSIATGSAHRDDHLRSSDFFDVDRYPAIVFRSTRILPRPTGFLMGGTLQMHGVARAIEIPFIETTKPIEDPHGSTLLYYSGSVRLARKDFNIMGGSAHNPWFDALRSASMTDSVDVTLDIAAWDTDFGRTKQYDAAVDRIAKDGLGPMLLRVERFRALPADSVRGADFEIDQLAQALLFRDRNSDAVALLKASADALPRSASLAAGLGRAYEAAGDPSAALAWADRALALDSLDPRALELRRRVGGRSRP